jgi:hypothetical protein
MGLTDRGACRWRPGWLRDLPHEIVIPEGWSAQANPYRLFRADGTVAATEGDEIRIMGEVPMDVSSVCQFGPQIIVGELETVPNG